MIDPGRLRTLVATEERQYTEADSHLYALSVGFGADPMDLHELPYVGGTPDSQVVPSMASIFAGVILQLTEGCQLRRPELALHAEQRLEIFATLRAADQLSIRGTVSELIDRGEKGAQIAMSVDAFRKSDGVRVYRATYVTLARGDGGFTAEPAPSVVRRPALERPTPDWSWSYTTRADQALLYALNGDPNPIHVDPRAAQGAGFARPILHGLCTYGIACRGVLRCVYGHDPRSLRSFNARFSAPVIPGDTLLLDMWGNTTQLSFELKAVERNVVVLRDGRCGSEVYS